MRSKGQKGPRGTGTWAIVACSRSAQCLQAGPGAGGTASPAFGAMHPSFVKKAFQECSLHSAAFLQGQGLSCRRIPSFGWGARLVMSGATGPKCECALQPSWSLTASRLQNFETRGQAPSSLGALGAPSAVLACFSQTRAYRTTKPHPRNHQNSQPSCLQLPFLQLCLHGRRLFGP